MTLVPIKRGGQESKGKQDIKITHLTVTVWLFIMMITSHGSKEWSTLFCVFYFTGHPLRSRVHLETQSLTNLLS